MASFWRVHSCVELRAHFCACTKIATLTASDNECIALVQRALRTRNECWRTPSERQRTCHHCYFSVRGRCVVHVWLAHNQHGLALNSAKCDIRLIERELLSIVFGMQRFHTYLYERDFNVITDNRPLVMITNTPIASVPPADVDPVTWLQLHDGAPTRFAKPSRRWFVAIAKSIQCHDHWHWLASRSSSFFDRATG